MAKEEIAQISSFNYETFLELVVEVRRRSIIEEFTQIQVKENKKAIEWNYALLLGSFASITELPENRENALRVSVGCLTSSDSTEKQKLGAIALLSAMGNYKAIDLAISKGIVPEDSRSSFTGTVSLDLFRKKMSLVRFTSELDPLVLNEFQSELCDLVDNGQWVSMSAPTSIGKSFIIKSIILDKLRTNDTFVAVYVVPTRALVEEIRKEFEDNISHDALVLSLPWDMRVQSSNKMIYVFTQERFHYWLEKFSSAKVDFLFIDEAQKLGDATRGVLLQRVIDEASHRNNNIQAVFASPLSSNPEIVLKGTSHAANSLIGHLVTVAQNVIHVNQVQGHPTQMSVDFVQNESYVHVGILNLAARPTSHSKMLAFVAYGLGHAQVGNVVYANTPSEAETIAGLIFDLLGQSGDVSQSPDIINLIELSNVSIHPKYLLGVFLSRGVAFHYGNMPSLARLEIERLFRNGTLKYLVCTSTLIEGVNLPCRNLFVRAPKKGRSIKMSEADFWNLAGRAGRWGLEFDGNIFCVDTKAINDWGQIPMQRSLSPMARATDEVLTDLPAFIEYIESGAPLASSALHPEREGVLSVLSTHVYNGRNIDELSWISLDANQSSDLQSKLEYSLHAISLPGSLLSKHHGISPFALEALAKYFADPLIEDNKLILYPPEDRDAAESFVRAFERIQVYLSQTFVQNERLFWPYAILLVKWMRGFPISALIDERMDFLRKRDGHVNMPGTIRSILYDVEQFARFKAPLYLSCYTDVLKFVRPGISTGGRGKLDSNDIAMMLELGVSRTTELSMIGLGVSRATAVALSQFIVEDELTPEGCLTWLKAHDLQSLGLPFLSYSELVQIVDNDKSE